MTFDLDRRTAALGVGEFASFTTGPRDSTAGGAAGLWRAQLGTHWHQQLRGQATREHAGAARFEVSITGQIVHRGWTFTFAGRIDQLLWQPDGAVLREVKSVTSALPADEAELRSAHPDYFVQLATYATLSRLGLARTTGAATPSPTTVESTAETDAALPAPARAELVFVEVGSGLVQTVLLTSGDEALFRVQLERVTEFLELRARARLRLRRLRFQPAFATPRPGQESTRRDLTARFERQPLVCFEAPTGFGKTGVLLEFALDQLRSGHFDRALYLTSKATGQIQVVHTLAAMTGQTSRAAALERSESVAGCNSTLSLRSSAATTPGGSARRDAHVVPDDTTSAVGTPVAVWHVRNKAEHCINHTFHCVRESCAHLTGAAERWARSGLARFYLDEAAARDLEALRGAGRQAGICPYEITRAALGFQDVWIGDYNYVFAPRNRTLFFEQPGFEPGRTLVLIDEAHNLPARVADAHSHAFGAAGAFAVREELHRVRPPSGLLGAWDHWCHFLHQLRANDGLSPSDEDDARHLLGEIARHLPSALLDFAALGPAASDALWQIPNLLAELGEPASPSATASALPLLWWCPRDGELALTCLDAAAAIGAQLREFGGVVLASATLTPLDGFAAACGLDAPPDVRPPPASPAPVRLGRLTKRDTRQLFRHLTSAADLLRVEEARDAAIPALLRAQAPWREGAYDVAIDTRVDTTFQHRSHHFETTALTIVSLHRAARGPVAVFFPSYAYAEAILAETSRLEPSLRLALQPRLRDLAAQSDWVDASLRDSQALLLVLGSSFAEGIDSLGGRISHAMVVGPALPEVNAVQRARLAEASQAGLDRAAAFRRVYQIPGMTKVNQALGRLVRAPGQRARVVLHCRRFAEAGYRELLAPEYRTGNRLDDDATLAAWLDSGGPLPPASGPPPATPPPGAGSPV